MALNPSPTTLGPLPLSLLMAPQAYSLDPNQPLGRQSAGAGLLEGYLRYGGNGRHHIAVVEQDHGHWFHAQACRYNQMAQTVMAPLADWGSAAAATGAIALPGPGLDEWAWKRMPWGDGAFSLVGVVHTLCSRPVQWGLGQFTAAPVRPWDALICTSTAASRVVEGFLERQEGWLQQRLGANRFERPQLPVIPLAVHPEGWAPKGGKQQAMAKARQELGIPNDALVVLLAGRLDVLTKFHPGPLLRELAWLQQHEFPKLRLLLYGEAPNPAMESMWRAGMAEAAPELPVHWLPGRQLELAGPVRWAADLFVSLPDNPQETFGITPLEAMAAELPCLVSDWDGYRDTVADSVGIRIPTRMVEGLGQEQSTGLLSETLHYSQAVGQIGQGIAVDGQALKAALRILLSDSELRSQLGTAGRQRVLQHYSWEVVMGQWRSLLLELAERRRHGLSQGEAGEPGLPPWLPNCSTGFGAFASEILERPFQAAAPEDLRAGISSRLQSPLESWDGGLKQELMELDPGQWDRLSPRALGWLLKQGLVSP